MKRLRAFIPVFRRKGGRKESSSFRERRISIVANFPHGDSRREGSPTGFMFGVGEWIQIIMINA